MQKSQIVCVFVCCLPSPGQCVSQYVMLEGWCIGSLGDDGRRAWPSHRCSTWLIDVSLVWSPLRENELHSWVMHPPNSQPHLSLQSLHSVNSWNATLLKAHSGMKPRWAHSNVIDSFRMFIRKALVYFFSFWHTLQAKLLGKISSSFTLIMYCINNCKKNLKKIKIKTYKDFAISW